MKKLFSVFLALLLCLIPALSAGAAARTASASRGYSTGKKADMSGYKGFTDKDHVFETATADDIIKALDGKKTFTLYFGFDTCPWCIEAVPVLNEAAKEYKTKVMYNNTRPNGTEHSNREMPDYQKIVNRLGISQLYVPYVVFVRKGEIVKRNEGTVDGHDATSAKMTAAQRQELLDIYRDGFAKEFRK